MRTPNISPYAAFPGSDDTPRLPQTLHSPTPLTRAIYAMARNQNTLLHIRQPNFRRRWSRIDGVGLLALIVVGVLYSWWTLGQ